MSNIPFQIPNLQGKVIKSKQTRDFIHLLLHLNTCTNKVSTGIQAKCVQDKRPLGHIAHMYLSKFL